ncbi:hypothetical protein V6259_17595 [Marinomonas sp. TI.3.20]|uniref:hypothetical protein n=1 Tax=Marinomonas sp. TI.3.20 TaxID=3121296 RepID=UPI00311EFA1D
MTQLQQILANLESVCFHDIPCIPVDYQHLVANNIEVLQDQLRKLLSLRQAAPTTSADRDKSAQTLKRGFREV